MTRSASRSGCAVLCAILLAAACSDEPEPTAPEPPPVTPVEPVNPDRAALVALYNSTTGSVWQQDRNWNTVADIGTWYGVDTNSAGRVTGWCWMTTILWGHCRRNSAVWHSWRGSFSMGIESRGESRPSWGI